MLSQPRDRSMTKRAITSSFRIHQIQIYTYHQRSVNKTENHPKMTKNNGVSLSKLQKFYSLKKCGKTHPKVLL
jgi:hypothetical protein